MMVEETKQNFDDMKTYMAETFENVSEDVSEAIINAVTVDGQYDQEAAYKIAGIFDSASPFITDKVQKAILDAADGNAETVERLVSLAESVGEAFKNALRTGIMSALAGEQDWKKKLNQEMRKGIATAVIDAFIQGAVTEGILSNFIAGLEQFFVDPTNIDWEGFDSYLNTELPKVEQGLQRLTTSFVNAFPPSLCDAFASPEDEADEADTEDVEAGRDAGTQISEITGPTRDLLIDLLRPLSILPSWTSMIRDIRNDVRAMARDQGLTLTPEAIVTPDSIGSVTNIQNQTITINNPTITTKARSVKELYRELSEYASKQKKGGKP